MQNTSEANVPKLFLVLDDQPHIATKMKRIYKREPCVLDPFTLASIEKWDIESSDARMVLLVIAILAQVDTASIECMHSWVKRICKRLGTMAKRPNLYDIDARHIAVKVKKQQEAHTMWLPTVEKSPHPQLVTRSSMPRHQTLGRQLNGAAAVAVHGAHL